LELTLGKMFLLLVVASADPQFSWRRIAFFICIVVHGAAVLYE